MKSKESTIMRFWEKIKKIMVYIVKSHYTLRTRFKILPRSVYYIKFERIQFTLTKVILKKLKGDIILIDIEIFFLNILFNIKCYC